MSDKEVRQNTFDIFPYDFVKENQVIANMTKDGYEVISPNKISPDLYHEIYKFLKNDFILTLCNAENFNELLTNTFSVNNASNDISEELSDEFDLQTFAGSISATEDLLSGSNDTPIIKLINGVISQAIKARASDIHFEPYEDRIVVRFRVDGILREVLSQDSKISSVLISRIKIISGLRYLGKKAASRWQGVSFSRR